MQYLKTVKEPELHRQHVIEGIWATRALHIDGQPITLDMVIHLV